MSFDEFKLIKLSDQECRGIVRWLQARYACLEPAIKNGSTVNPKCIVCDAVFGKPVDKECPCDRFSHDTVIDVAISLLEYNDFELKGDPEDYGRIAFGC